MRGILIVNKDKAMTSHDVVAILRRKLKIKRIGHTGTLDPNVTGVLPICIGNATRISEYIMHQGKSYDCTMEFGHATTSYDSDGEITESSDKVIFTKEEILRAFKHFTGEIMQSPPIYSAIKIKGKKLYEYARKDMDVEIPKRSVNIYGLELIELEGNKLRFNIDCSKGTYVRSLVHELALYLGTYAHMTSLVRTRVGRFYLDDCLSLSQIEEMSLADIESKLYSMEDSLYNLATIYIADDIEDRLNNGQKINIKSIKHQIKENDLGQIDYVNIVVNVQGKFLGIGRIQDNILKMERVLKSD